MAYALVGSIGAVLAGSSGGSVTPAWGTSETRAANNLLILWVEGKGSTTLPAAPSGWTLGEQISNSGGGGTDTASIFFKVAAGSDAAPTVAAITSATLTAQLAEFSGGAVSSPLDTVSGNAGTTSPLTISESSADALSGELLIACACDGYASTTGTKTCVISSNNATMTNTTNGGVSSLTDVYAFAYGITTSNSSADTVVATFYTSHTPIVGLVGCSFKLFVASTPSMPPEIIQPVFRN